MPSYVDVVVHLIDGSKFRKNRVILDSNIVPGWIFVTEESGDYSRIPTGSIFYIDVEV